MKKKKNIFQYNLIRDNETLWKIVKLFHPDIPETYVTKKGEVKFTKELIKASAQYMWVTIRFSVKEYGCIDLGITNCKNSTLWGQGVEKIHMKKAIKSGDVKFNVWRFILDKLYKKDEDLTFDKTSHEFINTESYLKRESYVNILTDAGYKLTDVDVWFEYYYSD